MISWNKGGISVNNAEEFFALLKDRAGKATPTLQGDTSMRGNTLMVAFVICLLIVFLFACDKLRGPAADGKMLFHKERCIYCHRFKGKGAAIGPDLTGVATRRSDEWIRDQIKNPRLHLKSRSFSPFFNFNGMRE